MHDWGVQKHATNIILYYFFTANTEEVSQSVCAKSTDQLSETRVCYIKLEDTNKFRYRQSSASNLTMLNFFRASV